MKKEDTKPPYKSVDEVKADFDAKVTEMNIEQGTSQLLLAFMLEENRQAWIRGKEFGWKKAWTWKRKGEAQTA
ncbi:hypothetical protein HOI83_00240 [Candidatus Uhrbacteria bacterium]|jgi:hypothetical protein|nr:hypothetical protein [Candidatus Uhrbacteria bacterium]